MSRRVGNTGGLFALRAKVVGFQVKRSSLVGNRVGVSPTHDRNKFVRAFVLRPGQARDSPLASSRAMSSLLRPFHKWQSPSPRFRCSVR
ncbi:hypothetical protein ACLKA6_007038 [Drosophila palustris]